MTLHMPTPGRYGRLALPDHRGPLGSQDLVVVGCFVVDEVPTTHKRGDSRA